MIRHKNQAKKLPQFTDPSADVKTSLNNWPKESLPPSLPSLIQLKISDRSSRKVGHLKNLKNFVHERTIFFDPTKQIYNVGRPP